MNKDSDKKMLFEAMHKVAGMPLNEEMVEGWGDEKSDFRKKEMNVGVEPDDTDWAALAKEYVKVGRSFTPVAYYSPSMGPSDGKIYVKNKAGEYIIKP